MTRRNFVRPAFVLSLAMAAVSMPTAVRAVVPIDGGPIVPFPVAIDMGAGDQYDAHVDGDLVSYSDGFQIRTYNFLTGENDAVPKPANSEDYLSDVSGSKISFNRAEPAGRRSILVYDTATGTATEVDPQGLAGRTEPSIGANTVAFVDQTLALNGELLVADIGGANSTRLTNDTRFDLNPSVAPLGDVLVWESWSADLVNCDIIRAMHGGVSWVVAPVTATVDPEANPHTDGVVITYDSIRAGEQDIYWQPVGGGPEQRIELPGLQRNPAVRAGVVTFESAVPGDSETDLFAYQIATNKLFRITTTQGTEESLNDVTVLPDGRVRVVWSSGPYLSRNVIGATFEIPCDHHTWYRDTDGDHYGDSSDTVFTCAQPPGYSDGGGDCDDSNPATYPYAVEVKDGADNQCPGDCTQGCGYGVVDEITGPTAWDGTTFTWPPQAGAETYQVVRSPVATFTSGCFEFGSTSANVIVDDANPGPGARYFYLVRSLTPAPPGSWGQRSNGVERTGGCLPP